MSNDAQWNNSRDVIERIFIKGSLCLETPTHFGNGDGTALVDMPLLYDPSDGRTPLLTGASIAGALRNYLREFEKGYGWAEDKQAQDKSKAELLFGHLDETNQDRKATVYSWLMIDDALGEFPAHNPIEIRDGVTINPKTGTAEEGKKFDIELLTAGTTFELNFELWLTGDDHDELLEALAIALQGLEAGNIGLGMRKRRGYGQCRVTGWQVARYKMDDVEGVLGWLNHSFAPKTEYQADILSLLFDEQLEADQVTAIKAQKHSGEVFTLDATFQLKGSLLIRSDTGGSNAADMVHLRSWRNGKEKPILSGTSLAGVIRGRALRIANTIKDKGAVATELVDGMFGKRIEESTDDPSGSRVLVKETEVKNGIKERIQNRVKIDRFTSGSYPQALFNQQPLFARTKDPTKVVVKLELRKNKGVDEKEEAVINKQFKAEVGLLLLVLKDLWTADLPVGGERSVGRGRLQGLHAALTCQGKEWSIVQNDTVLEIVGQDEMEDFVKALHTWPGIEIEMQKELSK